MSVKWTEEQQKVIDLRDRNILVSAAAGSGKTAVLVERIISRITDENDPADVDRLLVVTYTEAAAAEMKERIGAAIEKKLEEQHAQELKELTEKYEAELKDSKEAHEAELEKMKNLYDEQLAEVQEAFREKTAGFRKEIDHYKEQIEVLMLHIDDPFVLQEIQMKQSQQPQEKETE